MPILASSTYVNAYGKSSSVVAVTTAAPLDSVNGGLDAFVVKYNTAGKSVWSARIGSVQPDVGFGIATDTSGNVYVTGRGGFAPVFVCNADGSPFPLSLVHAGAGDAFVVKYNTNGVVQWTARVASAGADDVGFGIATDSDANVYVTGQAAAGRVFNADGTAFATLLGNSGSYDAFIVKYNTNGVVQWLARIGSTQSDIGYAIATDSTGNVYVTGQGGSGVVITAFSSNGTAFATTLPSGGGVNAFIVKYNTSGIVQWFTRVQSAGTDIGYGIATDSAGNVYLTGGSGGVMTLFNADGSSFSPTLTTDGADVYIIKYNTDGFGQWAARIESPASEIGYGIATDASGNVYVTAQGGGGTITAYNSNGTAFATTNPHAGGGDVVIAKYNTSGFVQWIARIASNAGDTGFGIASDSVGNVYVTGLVAGNRLGVTAYNSNGTIFATIQASLAGGGEVFLAKYNTNGAGQWLTHLTASGADSGRGIAIDSAGNSYTTGSFTGGRLTVYGRSLSLASTLPTIGGTDAFIIKYNTNGSPLWATQIASTAADAGYAITSDVNGNVYVTGEGGTGSVVTAYNANGSAFGTTLANAGGTDVFIAKYTSDGVVQWVARVASTGADIGYAVNTDSSGNLYVGGQAGAAMTAYNSDGSTFSPAITNAGNTDAFVAKYNSSGVVQWVARVASTGADRVFAIATDASGNVYVTGQGGSNAVVTVFNANGTAFPTTLANSGNTDTFLVKYDTNGSVQWVTRVASDFTDIGYSLATDSDGNVYLGCQGTVIVPRNSDGTAFTISFPPTFTVDAYIVKYNASGFVQWVGMVASVDADTALGIAIDSAGNVCVAGEMRRDPIIYSSNGTSYTQGVNAGGYIIKYNANGILQWHLATSSRNAGIGLDAAGNIYSFGSYGTPTTLTSFADSTGSTFAEVFGSASVVKYNTHGVGQWVQVVRGSATATTSRGISVDSFGNSYITGNGASGESIFIYNLDFTPYRVLNTMGATDAFVVKYSSNVTPQWINRITSLEIDIGYGIATDANANVFVCGRAGDNAVLFYNADGTVFGRTLPRTAAGNTGYVAKYDTNGMVQWIARLVTATIAFQITTDISGNAYVVGQAGATAFNSDGTAFSPSIPGVDAFIVKYNTAGFVQWHTRVGGSSTDIAYGVATDISGNILITGQSASGGAITAYNAGGTAFSPTMTTDGNNDAFIVKYNTNGVVQWLAKITSSGADAGFAVATGPTGDVYVAGQGGSAAVVTAFNFDGSAFSPTLANAGNSDAFIVKYNATGSVQWITSVAGTGADSATSIATDSAGNIYVSGTYSTLATSFSVGNIAFSPTLAAAGATDVFLVKYNADGVVQWNARISTFATDVSYDIVTDSAGSVYISGSSSAYVVAYNASGTLFGSAGDSVNGRNTGAFIVKYSSTGVVEWISTANGSGNDIPRGIAIDSSNNIYLTGEFGSSALVAYDG
jgi:hypothetical protein